MALADDIGNDRDDRDVHLAEVDIGVPNGGLDRYNDVAHIHNCDHPLIRSFRAEAPAPESIACDSRLAQRVTIYDQPEAWAIRDDDPAVHRPGRLRKEQLADLHHP
jgi:hypothetical protein